MRHFLIALSILWGVSLRTSGQTVQQIVELRDGMRLGPGEYLQKIDSISSNPSNKASANETASNSINAVNDGWRKTYFNASPRKVKSIAEDRSIQFTPIKFAAAAEAQRNPEAYNLKTVHVERISAFRPEGRRTLSVRTRDDRPQNLLQQITELTPQYARLELLRSSKGMDLVWDSREPLTNIPNDQLSAILQNQLDLSNPSEWIRMYQFYVAAERFNEAMRVLAEGIKRFPSELGPRKDLISQASQLFANKQFEEINIRREAGQWKLAAELLGAFDQTLLETQINAKNQLEDIRNTLTLIQDILSSLKGRIAKLPQSDQQIIEPIVAELFNEITVESAIRLDDYHRLQGNDTSPNENMVALAVGGWILGPGSGLQNFATAKSLVATRNLVKEYLTETSSAKREIILNRIKAEEGGQPQVVAKILANMKPPLPLSPHIQEDASGFHRQQITLPTGDVVDYVIQLPPEYDPNRKYPCILALPGSRGQFQSNMMINFWCGAQIELPELGKQRLGPASRYGYIVVCPNWLAEKQHTYQYTEMEKSRILSCFRDALRRTSINTDKVFITGHFDGAAAAWDIAGSHPDLWAGAVIFSPSADKFIVPYHFNFRANNEAPDQVPPATYFVMGEMDSFLLDEVPGSGNAITMTIERLLKESSCDTLFVTHLGQDRGVFPAELPRIFQWMQLVNHTRLKNPRFIDCVSLRSGDRMFYWLEAPQISPDHATNAFEFNLSKDANIKGKFEANLLEPGQNSIRISKIPSADRSVRVWLTPELVDFGRDVNFIFRDKKQKLTIEPKVEVMLEDVRTRADRIHFFWEVVVIK